jgi:hypothetical protein
MMTRVAAVIRRATSATSTLNVARSMSANTGRAPQYSTTLALATNVNDGRMTSSPGPTPSATSSRWSPVVHEQTATACLAPIRSANAASNAATRGP